MLADVKEIFSKPIVKEFRKKLQPFSNSSSMNIFDFLNHFEECVEIGLKRKKPQSGSPFKAVTKYLGAVL